MSEDVIEVENPEALAIALPCSSLWRNTYCVRDYAVVIGMFDLQANCFLEN